MVLGSGTLRLHTILEEVCLDPDRPLHGNRGSQGNQKATRTPIFFFPELFQLLLLNCLSHVMGPRYALLYCGP